MQVKLAEQLFLDIHLGVVCAEQEAVRQYDRRAAVLFQPVHDDGQEKIGGLAACEIVREVVFHVCLFAAAVGRVHKDHVKLIVFCVVQHVAEKRVIMEYARVVQPVQQKIGDAEHVRKLLFLYAVDRIAVFRGVGGAAHLFLQLFEPACDKAARATGKVCHLLANLRIDYLCHKFCQGSWSVELTRRAC